jgi:hypothetical protein
MNETSHASYTTAADATGNYDATQSTASWRPSIQGGPAGINDYGRWFTNSKACFLEIPVDATLLTHVKSDWTLEAWVYLEELPSAGNSYIVLAVTGPSNNETPADNKLLMFEVDENGRLELWWEYGSGANAAVVQTTGTQITVRTWHYIAVTAEVNGADRDVELFIDSGTPVATGSDTNASDGDDAECWIGRDDSAAGDKKNFWGMMSQMRFSTTVRSTAELNANAANSSYTFANDGNTRFLYTFQELPAVKDISGNGYHLHPASMGADSPIVDPLVMDGGKGRMPLDRGFACYHRDGLRQVLLGEHTLEFWGRLTRNTGEPVVTRWAGSGDTEPANFLTQLKLNESGTSYLAEDFWESGAGDNHGGSGASTVVRDEIEGTNMAQQTHHYAFVASIASGDRSLEAYLDGTSVESSIGTGTAPTGGDDPDATSDYGLQLFPFWYGTVDDVRLSNKARTGIELSASYDDGVFDGNGSGGPADEVDPIISNITPAASTDLTPTTTVGFDVTDDSGATLVEFVWVSFAATGDTEVVWTGDGFSPRYASSTRLPITDGFQYRINRVGGWPSAPQLAIKALDAGGNEA